MPLSNLVAIRKFKHLPGHVVANGYVVARSALGLGDACPEPVEGNQSPVIRRLLRQEQA